MYYFQRFLILAGLSFLIYLVSNDMIFQGLGYYPNSYVQIVIRIDMTMQGFEDIGGEDQFAEDISVLYGVDLKYIEIVNVTEGSVIIEYNVIESNDFTTADLQEIHDNTVTAGDMDTFYGATVLDISTELFNYIGCSSTQLLSTDGSGLCVDCDDYYKADSILGVCTQDTCLTSTQILNLNGTCSTCDANMVPDDDGLVCLSFIEMSITTFSYGDEITFEIKDSSDEVVCGTYPYGWDDVEFPSSTEDIEIDDCSLEVGQEYTLHCIDSYGDGWHGGYVTIAGTDYCEQFRDGYLETATFTFTN